MRALDTRIRHRVALRGAVLALGLLCLGTAWERNDGLAAQTQGPIEVVRAQGNVVLLATTGGNTTVQVGADGPLVVDTQTAALSAPVLEAIAALSPRPIRHIVLTSGGDQQAGGAAALSKAGRYVRVID